MYFLRLALLSLALGLLTTLAFSQSDSSTPGSALSFPAVLDGGSKDVPWFCKGNMYVSPNRVEFRPDDCASPCQRTCGDHQSEYVWSCDQLKRVDQRALGAKDQIALYSLTKRYWFVLYSKPQVDRFRDAVAATCRESNRGSNVSASPGSGGTARAAGVSQENTAAHGSENPALKVLKVADECGWGVGFAPSGTQIRISNNTKGVVRVQISLASSFPSTKGTMFDGEISARGQFLQEAPEDKVNSHVRECLPGMMTIVLPVARYVVMTSGVGLDALGGYDVLGDKGTGYCIDIGSSSPECTSDLAIPKDEKPVTEGSADTIRTQIDRIAQGSHQELPAPKQSSLAPGQTPGWSIQNATGYELHLYLSGPVEHSYVIANGSSVAVDLPAGSYRIAADVGHGVLPFYAVRQLGDARWSSHFYIAPH
jgi:hypothetical protein